MKWKVLLPHLLFMLFVTSCLKPPSVPGISSLNGRSYVPAFSVSSISPLGAIEFTTPTVSIYGDQFQNGASVTVGGLTCTSVSFISKTQLNCDIASLSTGLYSVVVTNVDLSTVTLSNIFQVVTPPSKPTSVVLNNPLVSPGNNKTPEFTVGGVVSGDTVKLFSDSGCSVEVGSSLASGTTINITTNTLADASYTIHANRKDFLGNTSPCSTVSSVYTLDSTAPTPPSSLTLFNPATSPGNDLTPQITINGVVNGDTVKLFSDNCITEVASGVSGGTSINLTSTSLSDGIYNLYAKAIDPLTNASACSASSVSYTVDTVLPSVLGLLDDAVETKSKVWSWSCDETCTYRFVIDQINNSNPSGSYNGTATATQPSGDGLYYIHVQAKDLAGNESVVVHVSVTLDNTSPTTPTGLGLANPAVSPGIILTPEIIINGVVSGDTVKLYSDNSCTTEVANGVSGGTSINLTSSTLTEAIYNLSATSTDPAGNVSFCSSPVNYNLDLTGPDAPTGIKFDVLGPMLLTETPLIEWTTSTATGSPLAYYEMAVYRVSPSSEHQGFSPVPGGDSVINYKLTGLSPFDPGEKYYVKIRGIDVLGNIGTHATSPVFISDYIQHKIDDAGATGSTSSAKFGSSISMKGNYLAVGEPGININASINARVKTFIKSAGSWTPGISIYYSSLSVSGKANNDQFGLVTAMSENFLAVSAPYNTTGTGVVAIYKNNGGSWDLKFQIVGPATGSLFGHSLAITDDYLTVGSPGNERVYVYERIADNNWTAAFPELNGLGGAGAKFGRSVAMSPGYIFIGAPNEAGGIGQVYFLVYSMGSWGGLIPLSNPASLPVGNMQYGENLALSGNKLAVGYLGSTNNEGGVYMFSGSGSTWTANSAIVVAKDPGSFDNFGSGNTLQNKRIALDGDRLLIGAPGKNLTPGSDVGVVYYYKYNSGGSSWDYQKKLFQESGSANDQFGGGLAADAGRVVIYAEDDGIGVDAGAIYNFVMP